MDLDQARPVADYPRAATSTSTGHRRQQSHLSQLIVAGLVVAAAAGGAVAGCHPTGTAIVDPVYTALFAALATVAASRSSRAPLLVLAAAGAGLSRGWLLVPGAAAALIAFAAVFPRRARRRVGALIGAVSVQVLLRWPPVGFHGLTALVAASIVALCWVTALTHVSTRARRWVLRTALGAAVLVAVATVPVVVGALLARPSINAGVAATEGALETVTGEGTVAGVAPLTAATADFSVASKRAGSWWTAGGLLVPIVAQQRRAVVGATKAGHDVTLTAATVVSTLDINDLGYGDGRFDLAHLRSLGPPINRLDASLGAAKGQVAAIRSPWLVAPVQAELDKLGAKLTQAHTSAGTAAQAVAAAPSILGGDGTRHYLIAFMTPAESRGLDGFIGAYGELTVANGRITLTRAGSVTQLNQVAPGKRRITGPADYLARYGAFHPADHFQDLSYSPDFPTVEQVIAQMYPQSGGDHIDGVLALDPYGLAALLKLTGPVTVPGLATPLSSTNAAAFLVKGEYDKYGNANAARHDFLQEALSDSFHRLLIDKLPAAQTIAQALDPEVRQGRILFWTDDPSEQPLLRHLGLAGQFPQTPGHDVLALTTQNSANNKIDAYLHRTIDDAVRFDPATGQTSSTLTIALQNAAPRTGLPPYVLGSFTGSGLPSGTNRTWLSLYTPLQFVAGTENGATLAVASIRELGLNTYSTFVNLAAGQTVTLKIDLAGTLRPGTTYALTVHNQPMVNADALRTTISTPAGWTIVASSGAPSDPAADQDQVHTEKFQRSR